MSSSAAVRLEAPNNELAGGNDYLPVARDVLTKEAGALNDLAESLGDSFNQMVEQLKNLQGRVILTGIGKSGHVARKIAATLASTGTPAMFLHPAEAAHGDMGMVDASDAMIILSNSGEMAELSILLPYARRFGILVIGWTRNPVSTLGQDVDICINFPDVPEVCPMGLAPTTSTTMMVALGDALAVSLMKSRGFDSDNFRIFHPGGALGRRLTRVRDLMHKDDAVPLIADTAQMNEAIEIMTKKGFGCVGVIDGGGDLVGIVTDGDLRRHLQDNLRDQPVVAIMTSKPKSISVGAVAAEAMKMMNSRAITTLFVVEENKPVGIIHLHDCLRAGVI